MAKARVLGANHSLRVTACGPGLRPLAPVPCCQGPVCVSSKLRLAERRQQRLREVQAKRDHLCEELAETQGRLMVEPGRWLEQCKCPPHYWAAGPSPAVPCPLVALRCWGRF